MDPALSTTESFNHINVCTHSLHAILPVRITLVLCEISHLWTFRSCDKRQPRFSGKAIIDIFSEYLSQSVFLCSLVARNSSLLASTKLIAKSTKQKNLIKLLFVQNS